ncbi:MAG: type I-E CRISPR-associated protein Cas7/Cse4/CasC [Desulfobacterales bacterium]|nr:type I-E CRISPR-associated protein Cas7/Cse4/CasC [Desulfobacterales bacterium]
MNDNRFIQLHLLVSYPPSNPNRDELGQPKTAIMGGTQRSRISSQSLKRAWRTSEIWKTEGLGIGTRTRELFLSKEHGLYNKLLEKHGEEDAEKYAKAILNVFADTEKVKQKKEATIDEKFVGKEIVTKQPIHFSDKEVARIKVMVDQLDKEPTEEQLKDLLDESPGDIDLAMFGRMIAKRPDANVEAAVQVAHAISINEVEIEDDFFTAVDDLNKHGSAHMGEQEFVSAIYYLYLCIDNKLLLANLNNNKSDNKEQAMQSLKALVKVAAMVAPTGKQNSYANRAQAFYILAEKGDAQPRNLSLAFLKAMPADDPMKAIDQLTCMKKKFNTAYTVDKKVEDKTKVAVDKTNEEKEMNLFKNGTLEGILNFIGGQQ